MSLARDRCAGGRRIARAILGGGPDDAALARVEGDDAGLGAADVRDHPAALDERRAGGAEEALRHVELLRGLVRPQHVATFDGGGTQLALGAEVYTTPSATTGTARGPSSKPKSSRYVVGEPLCHSVVPRAASIASTTSRSPIRWKRMTWLPTTTGPLSPCPIFFLQTTGGPPAGKAVTMAAPRYEPLRSGPRNCGQSAWTLIPSSSTAAVAMVGRIVIGARISAFALTRYRFAKGSADKTARQAPDLPTRRPPTRGRLLRL